MLGDISSDGKVGAIVSGNMVQLWDTTAVKALGEPLHHDSQVGAVAFSPDGRLLATGSQDGYIRLWEVAGRQLFRPPLKSSNMVLEVAFSPDGKLLADGTGSWLSHVFEVTTGQLLHYFYCDDWVPAVAFGPDGKILATAPENGMVLLWDTATEQQLGPPLQHEEPVWVMSFSPDGNILATVPGHKASTVRLWDISTGPSYISLELPAAAVRDKAALGSFSSDGTVLVRNLPEGKARIWRLPSAPTDLREMKLRTWVLLGIQCNEQGEVTKTKFNQISREIPWQQWQELREKLRSYEKSAPLAHEPEKSVEYYVPLALELDRDKAKQTLIDWQEALEIIRCVLGEKHPKTLASTAYLAWLQATSSVAELRNGDKAIEYATKACELTEWKNALYVDTLAAAYAETGNFDSAVKWEKEAISLLTKEEPAEQRAAFEERLKLYQSGKPYRESPSGSGSWYW
jgi:tetratricopeptide (TPR) repeat protein